MKWLLFVPLFAIALAASMILATAAVAAPPSQPTVHVVKRGDTLFGIATRYQTTVQAIVQANGLSATSIQVGQKLRIPDFATAWWYAPAVEPSKKLTDGASKNKPDSQLSSASAKSSGTTLTVPLTKSSDPASAPKKPAANSQASTTRHYTVAAGDTLMGIASRFGTTAEILASANNLSDVSMVPEGQDLVIPSKPDIKFTPPSQPLDQGKWIEVNIGARRVNAWVGDKLIFSFVASTGRPGYPTRRGTFKILDKLPVGVGNAINMTMPNWMGIYYAGPAENGFHGVPTDMTTKQLIWADYNVRNLSYGCIVMNLADSKTLYDWAEVGTPVQIHD